MASNATVIRLRVLSVAQIIQRAPHIFQLSLEGTLQPRLDCLKDQLGVTQEGLAKIIVK